MEKWLVKIHSIPSNNKKALIIEVMRAFLYFVSKQVTQKLATKPLSISNYVTKYVNISLIFLFSSITMNTRLSKSIKIR